MFLDEDLLALGERRHGSAGSSPSLREHAIVIYRQSAITKHGETQPHFCFPSVVLSHNSRI